jgi:glycosyltransferase involved in cell wall biosynthesis
MSFFSVIIPLCNKEDFIEETIKSVLNQTFIDFEVIIIDDGSTDKSFQIVSRIKDKRINLITQENKGVSIARNVGIEYAKSKYIALLDADDLWYENHLYELKKQIVLFPEAGLYCNNYEVFYKKNVSRKATFNFQHGANCLIIKDFFKASMINSVAWTSAVGFSKEKFISIGKFNTNFKTTQDLDLWIRFALQHKVSFNPIITMAYKLYINNSLSKNEYNIMRYDFLISYSKQEQLNPSLKTYLDINRYALGIRCKMNNEIELYEKVKKEIDYKNLNFKQKLLLRFPKVLLKFIKRFQHFLISKNIYLTTYS